MSSKFFQRHFFYVRALREVDGLRHYPGLVSTITEMLSGGGEEDIKMAIQTFDDAIEFWSQNVKFFSCKKVFTTSHVN